MIVVTVSLLIMKTVTRRSHSLEFEVIINQFPRVQIQTEPKTNERRMQKSWHGMFVFLVIGKQIAFQSLINVLIIIFYYSIIIIIKWLELFYYWTIYWKQMLLTSQPVEEKWKHNQIAAWFENDGSPFNCVLNWAKNCHRYATCISSHARLSKTRLYLPLSI